MLIATHRRGVSLAELLVVLAVLGVAAGALTRIATRQQQHYRAFATRTVALGQLREGSEVLASELAGISAQAGDIYDGEMRHASVGFRSTLGTYLLCAAPGTGTSDIDAIRLSLPRPGEPSITNDSPGELAAVGDSLWLYAVGSSAGDSVDRWSAHLVTATARIRRRCAPSPDTGDVPVIRLTITPSPSTAVEPHAPLRIFRRVRYALYRSSDAAWYLGFSDCRPVVRSPPCAPMQPVSGPYLPASSAGGSRPGGLTLTYLDCNGRPTNDRFAVVAIEVALRAGGSAAGDPSEPEVVQRLVALRNSVR